MIGVFGGTFDPVHFGHLRSALEVAEQLDLERVLMLPCHVPPHRDRPGASPAQRRAMLEAALAGQARLVLDSLELDRPGPSYMVDSLAALRDRYGPARPLVLILGQDAFAGLPGWHRWREIPALAHLAVMRRPGPEVPVPPELAPLPAAATGPAALRAAPGGKLWQGTVTALDISATAIRALVAEGRSPRYLVPEPVRALIERERLYAAGAGR